MEKINTLIPPRQGLLIAAAVGIATNNISTGLLLLFIFSFVAFLKSIKK